MTTFSPASNIWTLNYDPFGGICWQNRATQERYFIPPGPPPTLPPGSLANDVRQNFPNSLPVTPASIVHPPQGFREPALNNNNPASRVPDAAREGPVSFVGCTQPHPSTMIVTEDGNQCLPPRCLPNAPRRYYPNDPYLTPAVTARTQGPPLQQPQEGGTGVNINTNSVLKGPKDAKLRAASHVENMGSYTCLPMSRTEHATRGLPPTRSANAPLPSRRSEPHLNATTNDHAKASLLLKGEEGGQFDPSAIKVTEGAKQRPKSIAKKKKPRSSPPVARVEEAKHRLTANSLSNAPRSNISYDTTLIRENGGRGKFDNNSVLGIPEPIKLRPESNAQDEKPHPRLPTARVGNAKHRSSAKSFSNAPRSNISTNRSAASAAAKDDKPSLNRVQFDDNSTLKVPASEKVRPESISKNTKPRPSHFVSTAVDTRDNFSLKKTSNAPSSDIINDPSLNTTARVRNKASLNWDGGEAGQFDNNSALEISDTSLQWIAGTNPGSCTLMSRAKEARQWSRTRDNKGKEYYFNAITGKSQPKKPDCLKKYTCRR